MVYGRSIPCNGVECGGDDFTGGIESGGALLHAHGERIRGAFVLRETDDPAVRVFIVELGGAGFGTQRITVEKILAVVIDDVVAHHAVERSGSGAVR